MDAFFGSIENDLLGMLNTWQMGDILNIKNFNNTKEALANINCPALVMPSSTDLSFPARNKSLRLVKCLLEWLLLNKTWTLGWRNVNGINISRRCNFY